MEGFVQTIETDHLIVSGSLDRIKTNYLKALKENDVNGIEAWLTLGAPVDFRGQDRRTPLHKAAKNGQLEIVKILLRHKANINARDIYGITPLHLAACKSNKEILKHLIRHGANIEAKASRGFKAIHNAIVNRRFSNVIQLMKHGAKLYTQHNFEAYDEYGLTTLHWAVIEGDVDVVKNLLNHDIDINATILLSSNFQCCIEKEPVRSFKRMTALHLATILGHADILKILLDHGAINGRRNFDSEVPLNLAMHIGEVTMMLNDNEQITKQISAESHKMILSELLPISDMEAIDIGKMTPLLRATSKGLVTTVTQLLDWGADFQATDQNKNTALHIASSMGNLEIVTILLEKGAEINAVNLTNETPLLMAIQKGHQDIVNKLLANGAKLDISRLMPNVSQGNENCSLCFNPKNGIFAFQPCGHANACESCCVKLTFSEDAEMSKCPICRTTVTHFQRIYM